MTPQEAIKELKYQEKMRSKGIDYRVNNVVINEAISALEKQIPKKPVIHGYREGREVNTISYTCPVCNKHIDKDNYCKHCGNALDWSEEE